jgi:hypothetical protein
MTQFRTIGSRTVAEEAFLHVMRSTIETPTGDIIKRVVVKHPGAVAVVPILDGDVLLIDQYRAPLGRNLLEIPAGKLDVPGRIVVRPPRENSKKRSASPPAALTTSPTCSQLRASATRSSRSTGRSTLRPLL